MTITVEVAYALPEEQKIISLDVAEQSTAYDVVVQSGICDAFPDIDLAAAKMGIFGKAIAKPKEQALQEGDRIEIYRPLLIDPKESRKARAAKAKADKA